MDGVLLTMEDNRINFAKDISFILRRDYSDKLRVFSTEIPLSIGAAETSSKGSSIYTHDPNGLVAKAYPAFTKEVQSIGREMVAGHLIIKYFFLFLLPYSLITFILSSPLIS